MAQLTYFIWQITRKSQGLIEVSDSSFYSFDFVPNITLVENKLIQFILPVISPDIEEVFSDNR